MSDLEVLARPVMTPMVLGKSVVLNEQDQRLIVRWAIKTAMIIEGTKPQEMIKFFDEATRSRFMREEGLPPTIFVWIGRCNESGAFSNGANFEYVVNETGDKGYGSVTTIIAGCLVIQILSILMPISVINGVRLPMRGNHWNVSLAQIHPAISSSINWPPTISFHNLGGFMSLSELKYRWNPTDDGSSEPRL